MPTEANEDQSDDQFEQIGDLAVLIIDVLPEDANDGLVAGALGIVLGRLMADSFDSSLLMRNTLRMAEFGETVQGEMNAEEATKH